jgi:ABC-type multidrug transport system ATPase subunit
MGELDNIRKEEFQMKVNELYKKFYLESMKCVPMKHLSKGSLQKVAVIQALISRCDVLLLDEPLSGQDMNSQKNFISTIKELTSQGVTVIMSCHEAFLVDELSSKVFQIKDRKIVEGEKPKRERVSYNTMFFEENENGDRKFISELKDILECYEEEGTIKLKVKEGSSQKVLLKMIEGGYNLRYFK